MMDTIFPGFINIMKSWLVIFIFKLLTDRFQRSTNILCSWVDSAYNHNYYILERFSTWVVVVVVREPFSLMTSAICVQIRLTGQRLRRLCKPPDNGWEWVIYGVGSLPDNGWEWVIYGVGSLCLSFTPYNIEKTTNGMLRFLYFNYTW